MVRSHARKQDAHRRRGRSGEETHRQAVEKDRTRRRIPTGLSQLDAVLGGGLRTGRLTVLAARTAMGKSILGLSMAMHCAQDLDRPALIVSLEMSHQELFERMLASQSGVPTDRLRQRLQPGDRERLLEAGQQLEPAPLYIGGDRSTFTTVTGIEEECRRAEQRQDRKIELLLVDHLGLIARQWSPANRGHDAEKVVEGLAQLAANRRMAVVLVEQLSRDTEFRADHRPQLKDMDHAAAVRDHAHTVILLYRDAYYDPQFRDGPRYQQSPDPDVYPAYLFPRRGLPEPVEQAAELHVPRNEHGATGIAHVGVDLSRARFFDLLSSEQSATDPTSGTNQSHSRTR